MKQEIIDFYVDGSSDIDLPFLTKAIKMVHPLVDVVMKKVFAHYSAEDCKLAQDFNNIREKSPEGNMIIETHDDCKYIIFADIVDNKWKNGIGKYKENKELFHKLVCKSAEIFAYITYLFIRIETRVWKTPSLRWIFRENEKHIISFPAGKTNYVSVCKNVNTNIGILIKKYKQNTTNDKQHTI